MVRRRSGIRRENSREGRYVLVPDPKVVRKLLTRYASLRIAQAEREREATARELDDVIYTLCVMMGATDIHEAVAKADALLLAAGRAAPAAADVDGEDGLQLAV
jgi:phosphoribosyl-ATP pyrophosphohydrolase